MADSQTPVALPELSGGHHTIVLFHFSIVGKEGESIYDKERCLHFLGARQREVRTQTKTCGTRETPPASREGHAETVKRSRRILRCDDGCCMVGRYGFAICRNPVAANPIDHGDGYIVCPSSATPISTLSPAKPQLPTSRAAPHSHAYTPTEQPQICPPIPIPSHIRSRIPRMTMSPLPPPRNSPEMKPTSRSRRDSRRLSIPLWRGSSRCLTS